MRFTETFTLATALSLLIGIGQAKPITATSLANAPLSFEPNHGQTDSAVKFLSRGSGYTLFLTSSEAVLSLSRFKGKADLVSMRLVGANPKPRLSLRP